MTTRPEQPADVLGIVPVDTKVHVRIKLSALWASVMLCYLYADYFSLWQPEYIDGMAEGQGAMSTQGVLLGVSALMAIPSVMVFLTLVLPVRINRWANVALGACYSLIIVAAIAVPGAWAFYIFFGIIEIALTMTVAVLAWRHR